MVRVSIYIFAMLFSCFCHAININEAKLWTTAIFDGQFKTNPSYFYQFESHVRFNTTPFQLHQNVDRVRLGKRFNRHWDGIIGTDYIPTKLPANGTWVYFQSVWEQLTFNHQLNTNWKMMVWGRIDERRQLGQKGIGWLNRSGIRFSGCNKDSAACPVMFFENFYYINKPYWEDLRPWGQQRIYLAIKGVISPKTSVNVGYLGQFLWAQNISIRNDALSIVFFHHLD